MMRTGIALAFLLFAAPAMGADEKAFASLGGTFWRLETPPAGLERLTPQILLSPIGNGATP